MGLPDTYAMPVPNTKIFTATSEDYSNMFTCDYIKKATNIRKFGPAEIRKATGNYSAEITIGQARFYKGLLPNNQLIAVRRASQEESTQAKIEFINEIIVLSHINNKNVIKLLGCYFEKDVPSIVFEYLPNRTLYDHLFDKQNTCLLTWNDRLTIAAQVARVLAYLHTTAKMPIIHRDVRSMNILLDDNYMAKVCEFGISMPILQEPNEFNPRIEETWGWDGMETSVMGTHGYADPEYIRTGRLSRRSDVYSFGVVLAELLTRQEVILKAAVKKEERHLQIRFLKRLKYGRLTKILDEQLVKEGSMEQLKKVARLAAKCLRMKGEHRPSMMQVVRELEDIRGFRST